MKKMNEEQFKIWEKEIVVKAQTGDPEAINELIEYVLDTKGGAIWAVARKNTQHDRSADDFKQEFLIGAYKAIDQSDPERSPIGFIAQKGVWQMQSYLRTGYKKALMQHCNVCGGTSAPLTKHGFVVCPLCNNSTVGTIERFEIFSPADYSDSESPYQHLPATDTKTEEDIIEEEIINEFESRLSGRVLDVFRLLIRDEINRMTSRNYIKEIAGILGISTSNVNLRLRTIKNEWTEFVEEIEADDQRERTTQTVTSQKITIEE